MLLNGEEIQDSVEGTEENQPPNRDERMTEDKHNFSRGPRGSIFFDTQKNRLTYSRMNRMSRNAIQPMDKRVTVSRTSSLQDKKISSEYLESLTPDKLSELKYIFQICDPQNTGEFSYLQVEKRKYFIKII
mgnify:FL=1